MEDLVIGSHVSYNKKEGLVGSVKEALSYNANTFMFYTGAPQNTVRGPIDENVVREAKKLMEENNIDIKNVVIHAPYIVNLANDKEEEKEEDNSDELSREDIEETIINNIAKANNDNFTDELEETKTDLDESIHDTEILEEIKTREEEVDKKALSKREIRRLEKEKALKEARELKKMRDDFLKTEEFEMVDVSDDETESKKNKKGKRKKK